MIANQEKAKRSGKGLMSHVLCVTQSEPDHLSTCTLGDVNETESEWNIWQEDLKWLTYSEI